MSEHKHTPGPWILDYDKGSTRDILSLEHGGICMVRVAGRHSKETFDANALLIAAAPDLLAALECVLKHASFDGVTGQLAHTRARVAIAKATRGSL